MLNDNMMNRPNEKQKKLANVMKYVDVCQDFSIGASRVINKNYLPQWSKESESAYHNRILTTSFPNFYSTIVTTLSGLITQKEPLVEGFKGLDFDDIDLNGNTLSNFIKKVCFSSIVNGVEFIAALSNVELNKVYLKRYNYKDLYSYKVNNNRVTQMVFRDVIEVSNESGFGVKELERFFVFNESGGEIWHADDENSNVLSKKEEWFNNLGVVPVVSVVSGVEKSKFEFIPKFYDIARLNHVILLLKSNLANILNVVSNPVPVFYGKIGADDGKGHITIGVRDAILFSNKKEEGFEYVEIEGKGVDKLQEELKRVAEEIDRLAFNLIYKSDSKTVIDAQENQLKSSSFLTTLAEEIESKMNIILGLLLRLDNRDFDEEKDKIELKKNFENQIVNKETLELWYKMVENEHLSLQTFWDRLKTLNILPQDFDNVKELELLESEHGSMMKKEQGFSD